MKKRHDIVIVLNSGDVNRIAIIFKEIYSIPEEIIRVVVKYEKSFNIIYNTNILKMMMGN